MIEVNEFLLRNKFKLIAFNNQRMTGLYKNEKSLKLINKILKNQKINDIFFNLACLYIYMPFL